METGKLTVKFYYPLIKKQRDLLRSVRPSHWEREGLRLATNEKGDVVKWRHFRITPQDLVCWAGGMEKLMRRYRTVDEAADYLWSVYDREAPHIYRWFDLVTEREPAEFRSYVERFFAG